MDQPPQFARNLRVLLWKEGLEPAAWVTRTSAWAGCSMERAKTLLLGAPPSSDELDRTAEATRHQADELAYEDLLTNENVLAQNIEFLFNSMPHGGQRDLAAELEVSETTVSRWKAGKIKPSAAHLDRLRMYFLLPGNLDLTSVPLFLEMDPVGGFAKREWALERMRTMSVSEIESLFPALRKLLA